MEAMETALHPPPLSGALPDHGVADKPHRAPTNPNLDEGVERPAPAAKRTLTSRNSFLLRPFSPAELRKRVAVAKRTQTVRV